tara:strand:+ start:13585 stop:13998 length:414 start_codon:yes stop_codon:yes gene_type:complete
MIPVNASLCLYRKTSNNIFFMKDPNKFPNSRSIKGMYVKVEKYGGHFAFSTKQTDECTLVLINTLTFQMYGIPEPVLERFRQKKNWEVELTIIAYNGNTTRNAIEHEDILSIPIKFTSDTKMTQDLGRHEVKFAEDK